MKKGNYQFLGILFLAASVFFSACKDENDDPPDPPQIQDTEYVEVERKNGDGDVIEKIVTIKDHGKGTGDMVFTSDKTWVAEGRVFVNDGQTLTIEAGTILKGKSGQGENASVFVIARGAKINADGKADMPIIMTAEADEIYYDLVEEKVVTSNNIPVTTRGLWGGLIILGKATSNNITEEKSIEGIPTTESRGLYGGNDDGDNSGTIKYVSIRHGGTDIGEGNEINGMTLGCVGDGTYIDYVEVISNKDDGIEWFGGTVKCDHLLVAFCGDDAFDYDEGFRGQGQFWTCIQDPNAGDRIGEHDGGPKDNEFGEPYAKPVIYNVTYVGRGPDEGKRIITFRDNAGGIYANSIFLNQADGIDIEWLNGADCSFIQWNDKDNLEVKNNIFWGVADGSASGIFTLSGDDNPPAQHVTDWQNYFVTAKNMISDPGVTIDLGAGLQLNPTNDVSGNMAAYPQGFQQVNYKGAFEPGAANWLKGWTLLDHAGYIQ